MTKKTWDLRINPRGGFVQMMRDGFLADVYDLAYGTRPPADHFVIFEGPRARYRVQKIDLNYPPMRVFLERNEAVEVDA